MSVNTETRFEEVTHFKNSRVYFYFLFNEEKQLVSLSIFQVIVLSKHTYNASQSSFGQSYRKLKEEIIYFNSRGRTYIKSFIW